MAKTKHSQANQGDDHKQIKENTEDNSGLKTVMAEPTHQQENQRLKNEVQILKEVLASVVSEGNALLKPEDLTVDVSDDAVLIHGEAEDGSNRKGFTYQQFKWRYPLSNTVSFKDGNEQATLNTQEIDPNVNNRSKNLKRGIQANSTTQETDQNVDGNCQPPKQGKLQSCKSPVPEIANRSPQLIYNIFIKNLVSGEKTRLQVKSSDTIAIVKKKIGEKLGFPPENQVLQLLGPGILENAKTVADYYIRNNTDIALSVKTHDSIVIRVDGYDGETHFLAASSSKTVQHIKTMIRYLTGLPENVQRIMFKGGSLEDHHPLKDYNVKNGSVFQLYQNQSGD